MVRVVVLHSGGLDSTVCLLMAREKYADVLSLGVDYGQRHRIELEFAELQCRKWGIQRQMISLKWERSNKEIPLDRKPEEMKSSVSRAFLPGRNMLFLAVALAQAETLDAAEVWIGVNSIDFSGYPDCKPEFVESFAAAAAKGIPNGPKIIAPLQLLSKPQIAAEASRLGVTREDTWSCYVPRLLAGGIVPCGRCDACILHDYAWRTAGVTLAKRTP